MAQVNVMIAGRAYRMACGDGEEPHLEGLAALYDGKINELRESFGEIGDMRLHVMAALMVADEMSEIKKRLDALEQRLTAAKGEAGSADARLEELEERMAKVLGTAADRIERVARSLSQTSGS
ncbi:MAG: cell division protein ZapA [Bosea sp. (in: a-proteobacteria)]